MSDPPVFRLQSVNALDDGVEGRKALARAIRRRLIN